MLAGAPYGGPLSATFPTLRAYNQRGFSKRYLHNSQRTKTDNEAIRNGRF